MADERPDIDELEKFDINDPADAPEGDDGAAAPEERAASDAEAAEAGAAQDEAGAAEGEGEAAEPAFDMDPELAAAMAEAEASYERKHPKGSAGEQAPAAGAGEGLVRALAELTQARDALEKAENKVQLLEERMMRTAADFENYKKRMAREREDDRKFANEKLLKDILPVLDNLERALDAAESASDSQLLTGVQMVHRQMLQVLGRYGIEQFSAKGEPFNPERHEAMQQLETDEVPPGHVAVEYLRGYTLNGRLIRPAMVVVASAPSGAQEDPPAAEAEGTVGQGGAAADKPGDGGTET